jgi:hypothetical protein
MRTLLVTLVLVLPIAGCLGENRKLKDDSKEKAAAAEGKTAAPWIVYREIETPAAFETTTRLAIARDGAISLDHGTTRLQDPLTPDERHELEALGQRISWDRLPTEYVPRTTAAPPKNPRTYEVTFYGGATRTVTTHDGVDNEDEALQKLRERLGAISRRIRMAGER